MTTNLTENTITFGKYKDLDLEKMLRDRKYCSWLLKQEWFPKQYEYLYNRVTEYNPRIFFVTKPHYNLEHNLLEIVPFLENYEYFYLRPLEDLKIALSDTEKKCYSFYLEIINLLKKKIENNLKENPFDIKAPVSWLKKFEDSTGLSRDIFKEFLTAYDLPNVPYIVEDIKKMGGITYNGARSYIIAKENSLKQEKFWEDILKGEYGEEICTQYKYKKCVFDFINISTNTLYECKLGIKDFNEGQHNKYLATLGSFKMIYLISNNCIVDIGQSTIFTSDPEEYSNYLMSIPTMKEPSKFDLLIANFNLDEIRPIEKYFVN